MTATHTPGPWTFDSTATGATVYQEMAGTIATIPADLLAYRANARLIAAAPEMLAALQALVEEYEPNLKAFALNAPRKAKWESAVAAIARATGEA